MKPVKIFQFTLSLKNISQNTLHLEDSLYEAGCDDALIHFKNGDVYLDFDREAASLEDAVVTAIENVKAAFMDAEVVSVSPGDLVTEAEIAKRLNLTRQTVSLWIKGERRKLFPQPIMRLTEKSLLWSWSQVTEWLYKNNITKDIELVESARFIANINSVLGDCNQNTKEAKQRLMAKIEIYNSQPPKVNRLRMMEPDKNYEIAMQVDYEENPKDEDIRILNAGVMKYAFSQKAMEPLEFFAYFIRDKNKKIYGGCGGTKIYGCIHVDNLWVDEALRHQGYGTQLIQAVEDKARKSECRFMTVNTMDWEALDFYKKMGFHVEFERHGFDKNSIFYFLRKDLK